MKVHGQSLVINATDSSRGAGLLQRKCACGSTTASLTGECAECNSKKLVQTKLTIGASNDPFEQEADRVADQVLAASSRPAVSGTTPHIQRLTGQPSASAGTAAPPSVDRALASPGRPLEPALRRDMEQRFGHDFSRVRVHSGTAADKSAQDVNAHAYTVGQDIVFGEGRFEPGAREGRRLLAHELTHVVQQSHTPGNSPAVQCKGRGPGSCGWLDDAAATVLGTQAHKQIQVRLAGRGFAVEMPIPRASKTSVADIGSRKCQPPGKETGFADVALINRPVVGISEIKPWWRARTSGRFEANHYRLRAEQSKQRITGSGPCKSGKTGMEGDDIAFNLVVRPLTAASTFTLLKGAIAGMEDFGPFKLDRKSNLMAEEVAPGAIGYWCALSEEEKKKRKEDKEKEKERKKKEKERKKKEKREKAEKKKAEKQKRKPDKGKGEKVSKEKPKETPKKPKETPKETPKKEPKKPKETPKSKPSAGAANVGFGISIFGSSSGAGNAGVGVSVGSNSVAFGTAGAGVSWFSDSAAAGSAGAGASIDSSSAGAAVVGAGITQDSESASAGAAGAGENEGSTTAGAGVASSGKVKDSQSAGAGAAGTGEVKDSTTATAGSSGSGKQEGVTGAGTGSPNKPIDPKDVTGPDAEKTPEGHGDAEVVPGKGAKPGDVDSQSDKPSGGAAPGKADGSKEADDGEVSGDKEAGGHGSGQQKKPGEGTGQSTGVGKNGGGEAGDKGEVEKGTGGEADKTGTPGATGTPGVSTGTTGEAKKTGTPGDAQTGTPGDAQTGTGVGSGKVDLGVMPVFPWSATDAERDKVAKEAAKVVVMLTKATPAQKLLLLHLASKEATGQYVVPASEWMRKLLKVTEGLTPEEIEFIKNLDWKPGSISEEELRKRLLKALKNRDQPPATHVADKKPGATIHPAKAGSGGGQGGGQGSGAGSEAAVGKAGGKPASKRKPAGDLSAGKRDSATAPPPGSDPRTQAIFKFSILSGLNASSTPNSGEVIICSLNIEDQGRVFRLDGVRITFYARVQTRMVLPDGTEQIVTDLKFYFTDDFWSEKNKFYGKGGPDSLTYIRIIEPVKKR